MVEEIPYDSADGSILVQHCCLGILVCPQVLPEPTMHRRVMVHRSRLVCQRYFLLSIPTILQANLQGQDQPRQEGQLKPTNPPQLTRFVKRLYYVTIC
jgi:hypothetical protein